MIGRIGVIFFLSGIGGSLFGTLFLQHHVSAGASTPLFGLLGAMLSDLITNLPRHKTKVGLTIVYIWDFDKTSIITLKV